MNTIRTFQSILLGMIIILTEKTYIVMKMIMSALPFCKAVLKMLIRIDFIPDIIHCNDWQTGPIPLLLKENYHDDSFIIQF